MLCLRLQRYGDSRTPTIPMMGHSAYHIYGISTKIALKSPIFGQKKPRHFAATGPFSRI